MSQAAIQDQHRLQDGIYFLRQQRREPRPCYRLLLLKVKPGTTHQKAGDAIERVWKKTRELVAGVVREPNGDEIGVPPGGLTCLLGFGASLFGHTPSLTPGGACPEQLVKLGDWPFPQLRWVEAVDRRPGEEDLALQFIGHTDLAVNRAVVEVHLFLAEGEGLPLETVTFHNGFSRDDRLSWLNFHDGTNNMDQNERRVAIEVKNDAQSPPWMDGGTYMAFLRLNIDLPAWRNLTRNDQEVLVGRDKLTGCPIVDVRPGPTPVPAGNCSGPPGRQSAPIHRDPAPPSLNQRLLQASHIHRANLNRGGPNEAENNRIYRQGYEFVEALADGRLHLGLNFVSFQRRLNMLTDTLWAPNWLGDVNFGGPTIPQQGDPKPIRLLSVIAGGFYAVPPVDKPFPGASIFFA